MKLKACHSHLNGLEWIKIKKPNIWQEINDVIDSVDATKFKTKIGREKGNKGKKLYSPEELNKEFDRKFSDLGWNEQGRKYFYCQSDPEINKKLLEMTFEEQKQYNLEHPELELIKSYNSSDFDKERVAIEVQFGKYSFVQFDIFIKHASDYMNDHIDVGIEIVPMKAMEDEMSSGPPYYEKHLHEIQRQGRVFPPVPLILIGIEP